MLTQEFAELSLKPHSMIEPQPTAVRGPVSAEPSQHALRAFRSSKALPRLTPVNQVFGRVRLRVRTAPDALDCWIYQPVARDPGAAPLIAVHGIRRGAREQAELLAAQAEASGTTVIAPLFDLDRWPQYQKAVVRGRADKALLRLCDELRAEGIIQGHRFAICGFSGGAQFAHRFAMLHPKLVERLIVSSAGWYTFPDKATFPYGMTPPQNRRAVDDMARNLEAFLQIPITITIGSRDNRRDANTRSGEAIDAQQGPVRFERAHRWADALKKRARQLGIAAKIETIVLDRCRHSFRRCVLRGGLASIILPSPTPHEQRQMRAPQWAMASC